MKTAISAITLTIAITIPGLANATGAAILTGDPALACEAILCLAASGTKPQECNKSLQRYFSIKAKKKNLAKARANFLKLCPQ